MSDTPKLDPAPFRSGLLRVTETAARQLAWWRGLAERWNPLVLIFAAWAVLVLPLVFLRGFNSDEGVAISIARTAIEDGYWLTPHVFNVRFVERPTLLSWVIAAISLPFDGVSQFTARLPIALSVLGGCLLIFWLLRKVASAPAALLGAALFLTCPIVLRAYVMSTADLPLAVLMFAAFAVWWVGCASGRISPGRWAAIGVILAFAGLMKGPQPVGYFALGIGLFILVTRSWKQIRGFVLAGVISALPLLAWYAYVYTPGDTGTWAGFMRLQVSMPLAGPMEASLRLVVNMLPATLLATAFLAINRLRDSGSASARFILALACYAFTCTLVILFWPGGSTPRYFFPMVLPLCVLGGLAFDALAAGRPLLVAPVLTVTLGLLGYAFVYSAIAAPLLPQQFRGSKIDGARIAQAVRDKPGPIYRTGPTGLNELLYVPTRIINVGFETLETIEGPAWLAVPNDEATAILAKRKDRLHPVLSFGRSNESQLLWLDR
jgi:4-amino-4-deoxy-L-arabinose transferase-like glycosyltransferase